MTGSALHSLSQALRGLALAFWLLAILGVSILFVRRSGISKKIRQTFAASYTYLRGRVKTTKDRGWARSWPLIFAACTAGPLAVMLAYPPKYEIETHYNVAVLEQVSGDSWWMMIDGTKQLYTGCNNFPNDQVIWPGYVARMVKYEERGHCKSIRGAGLGFIWARDNNGNVKEIR